MLSFFFFLIIFIIIILNIPKFTKWSRVLCMTLLYSLFFMSPGLIFISDHWWKFQSLCQFLQTLPIYILIWHREQLTRSVSSFFVVLLMYFLFFLLIYHSVSPSISLARETQVFICLLSAVVPFKILRLLLPYPSSLPSNSYWNKCSLWEQEEINVSLLYLMAVYLFIKLPFDELMFLWWIKL